MADESWAVAGSSGGPVPVAPFVPTCPEEASAAADDEYDAETAMDREAAEWMDQSLDVDLRWEDWVRDEDPSYSARGQAPAPCAQTEL